jgi:hypothetical protein
MSPPFSTAASLVPSEEEVIDCQVRDPAAVWSVQFTPPSIEVYMSPPSAVAASFMPSEEEVINSQPRDPEPA